MIFFYSSTPEPFKNFAFLSNNHLGLTGKFSLSNFPFLNFFSPTKAIMAALSPQRLISGKNAEIDKRRKQLYDSLSCLNEREKSIFISRRMDEDSKTLEELSQRFGISRERVRQIESKAFDKVKSFISRTN